MALAVTPTESSTFTALGNVLSALVGIPFVQGQQNRVAEPKVVDFGTMTVMRRPRLGTNRDEDRDVVFSGSIAGTTLTATDVRLGPIEDGATVFGVGVLDATLVVDQLTGPPGGAGTYLLSNSQTVATRKLSAGGKDMTQPTMTVVQVDVHGPKSNDNATVISTSLRDEYGVALFEAQGFPGITPLYADDPRQAPFTNDQNQVENRWIVEVALQVDATVRVPQQYADQVVVGLISVDAVYPPE